MTCIQKKIVFVVLFSISRKPNISIPGRLYCFRDRQMSGDVFKH